MLWIGITGPMGSGKSTVAHLLRQMGFEVLDADAVAHKVLSPGSSGEAEVLKTFGQDLQDERGRLDRRALGRMVFAEQSKLHKLEAIIHPLVRAEVSAQKNRLSANGALAAFYDVPLLFEKGMRDQFDYVVVVSASSENRLRRIKTRSQLTDDEIAERTKHHLAPEFKEAAASVVVHNDAGLPELKIELQRALKQLKIPLPTTSPD